MKKIGLLIVCLAVLLLLPACGTARMEPRPTATIAIPTLTSTATPTPTPPLVPASPVPTSTPTTTSIPQLPVLAGTPVPQPLAAISPENADQVTELARWRKGPVNKVACSTDGQMLASGGGGYEGDYTVWLWGIPVEEPYTDNDQSQGETKR